jgi:hypothetical protein
VIAAYGRYRASRRWSLLINVLLFIVFLSFYSFFALVDTGRIAIGVMLSALYALPALDRLTNGNRLWLWVSGALWVSATPDLVWLPVARAVIHAAAHMP